MRQTLTDRTVIARIQARTREAAQQALVEMARRELAAVQAEAQPSGTEQFVDGRKGVALETVKPGGIIHFEFSYLQEIVRAALSELESASPVDTGKYFSSHEVYVDGARVSSLDAIANARRVVVSNTVDYARVIEIGIGKKVPWSKRPQVPKEGVYHHAVKALRRRFGNIADIRYAWVGLDASHETGSNASKDRFPAIVIEQR